jgi:hypothetical protein
VGNLEADRRRFRVGPVLCPVRRRLCRPIGREVGPSAISFTIRFKDAASALAGFKSGFLGLRPEPAMQAPGLVHGLQTQLTADSWTYDQTDQAPPVFVAFWANRQFDLCLLVERPPAATALSAASGMNGRVR